mgnify:CR=1 FL=1
MPGARIELLVESRGGQGVATSLDDKLRVHLALLTWLVYLVKCSCKILRCVEDLMRCGVQVSWGERLEALQGLTVVGWQACELANQQSRPLPTFAG